MLFWQKYGNKGYGKYDWLFSAGCNRNSRIDYSALFSQVLLISDFFSSNSSIKLKSSDVVPACYITRPRW